MNTENWLNAVRACEAVQREVSRWIGENHAGADWDQLAFPKCDDYSVGPLNALSGATAFDYVPSAEAAGAAPGHSRIFVVLESPHRDEYRCDPPKPAHGVTGAKIRLRLAISLQIDPKDNPVVWLVNAIQFPCSLFKLLPGRRLDARVRDAAFRAVWRNGGAKDFEARMLQYVRPHDLIVNACTKGSTSPALRDHVQASIDEFARTAAGVTFSRRTHPASWRTNEQAKRPWTYLRKPEE